MNVLDLSLDSNVFISSTAEAALQEIDLLFNTENGDLIGYPTFGTDFESFLWEMTPSPNSIKEYIKDKIQRHTYFCKEFDVVVEVKVLPGEFRSVYNVYIALRDNPNSLSASGFRVYQLR